MKGITKMKEIEIEKIQELIDALDSNIDNYIIDDVTDNNQNVNKLALNIEFKLRDFFKHFLDSNLYDPNYVENFQKINENDIEKLSYDETLTTLTKIIKDCELNDKQDLYKYINNGTMLEILTKILNYIQPKDNVLDTQFLSDVANLINIREHSDQLFIPMLDGLVQQNIDDPNNILVAVGNGFIEQLVLDGPMEDDTFVDRVNLVIENTKIFMNENACKNVDNSILFYKNYNNGVFEFKIYIQDLIIPVDDEIKVFRNFLAFFVEPEMNDFYQLSIGSGPFIYPTEQLKLGVIDLKEDQITIALNDLLNILLDNIKYRNN